jgi:hypothetical protein
MRRCEACGAGGGRSVRHKWLCARCLRDRGRRASSAPAPRVAAKGTRATAKSKRPNAASLRFGETRKAWCPECGTELRPHEVLGGACPECGRVLDQVRVDWETVRAIEREARTV